jgi:hypothetical protein
VFWACGSHASRSTINGQGAGITGLGSSPSACSPDIGESGSGDSGPGDDVVVSSSIDVANPREGAADGDWGGWYSWDCSEGVGECCDGELGEGGEGVRGMAGGERDRGSRLHFL